MTANSPVSEADIHEQWIASMNRIAERFDLSDPDGRAAFREAVEDHARHARVRYLRRLVNHYCVRKVPGNASRHDTLRALTTEVIYRQRLRRASPWTWSTYGSMPKGKKWCPSCNGYGTSLAEEAVKCSNPGCELGLVDR